MRTLTILSGGAAQGLVCRLAPAFKTETESEIEGEFGAVGMMADRLRDGAPADLVILTAALVARLADENLLVPTSIREIGLVETALATRAGDPKVNAADAPDLRRAFLAADEIFVPDIRASTAGIHVAKVLDRLGIAEQVAHRLRVFPNGATAMRQLAASKARRPIGCTQSTEIIATEGVALSGPLPNGCDLATMYSAGITARAVHPHEAKLLIDLLTGGRQQDLRIRIGFAGG